MVFAGSAAACSCAPSSPAESLASADAAVAARLLSVEPQGASKAVYRYRVLHVYRGQEAIESGSVLSVLSSRDSAACGLPTRLGAHYGLFLLGDGQRWASGLCGVISPRRLWSAARKPGGGEAASASLNCAS